MPIFGAIEIMDRGTRGFGGRECARRSKFPAPRADFAKPAALRAGAAGINWNE